MIKGIVMTEILHQIWKGWNGPKNLRTKGDPLPPQASVAPPPWVLGGATELCEEGGGRPNSDEGTVCIIYYNPSTILLYISLRSISKGQENQNDFQDYSR